MANGFDELNSKLVFFHNYERCVLLKTFQPFISCYDYNKNFFWNFVILLPSLNECCVHFLFPV